MKIALRGLRDAPLLELQLVIGGPLIGEDYLGLVAELSADGFLVSYKLQYSFNDSSLLGTAISAAECMRACVDMFSELEPDVVLLIADRYEVLAMAQAALSLNIHIAHLEGGEVSGSIDERIRHAITKLAHIHFPANHQAAERLSRMGELRENIHVVGSPSLDLLEGLNLGDTKSLHEKLIRDGIGDNIDLNNPYLVVSQHAVVTQFDGTEEEFAATIDAVVATNLPSIWIKPNVDAGKSRIDAEIDALLARKKHPPMRVITNLFFEEYAVLLFNAACLIGNSSSGIRESAYLGVPVVNVGERQRGRQRGINVKDAPANTSAILDAIRSQLSSPRPQSNSVYGDGRAGKKIAAVLSQDLPELDKMIAY